MSCLVTAIVQLHSFYNLQKWIWNGVILSRLLHIFANIID